jgi:hypothetical protein
LWGVGAFVWDPFSRVNTLFGNETESQSAKSLQSKAIVNISVIGRFREIVHFARF